jgi:hypothetical protein
MARPDYKTLATADMAYLVIAARIQWNGASSRRPENPFTTEYVINGTPENMKELFRQLKKNPREFIRKQYPDKFGHEFHSPYRLHQVTQAKLYSQGRVQKLRSCDPSGCCLFRYIR